MILDKRNALGKSSLVPVPIFAFLPVLLSLSLLLSLPLTRNSI